MREFYKQAVLRLCRYLLATKEEGMFFKIGKEQNMELWCIANFVETGGRKNRTWNNLQLIREQDM